MQRPSQLVVARILEHHDRLATAAPVWHELTYGCRRLPPSRKRTLLEAYLDELSGLAVLPYDTSAASWHAAERARLERSGMTPSFVDGQIAAVAHVNDLVLVTRNVADFRSFAGIQLEDWFEFDSGA